jgi:hypothetical protein
MIDIKMDEHNAEEEMEIAENAHSLQNPYTIYQNTMNHHWKGNSERNTICHMKKLPVTEINFLLQEEPSCHKKKLKVKGKNSCDRKKPHVEEEMEITENAHLLQNAYKIFKNTMNNHWKENSERNTICHMKKLPVTEINFLLQEEPSCHKKKLIVKGKISCDRKKPHVTVNVLSQEEPPVTIRNLLSQEETSCHMKKLPVT